MTYAKAFRPASRALSGQHGNDIVTRFCQNGRGRRDRVIGWLFLSEKHLEMPDVLETISKLDARIGVIIRLYDGQEPRFHRAALSILRAQRRPTQIGGRVESAAKGLGQHIPQWQRPRRRGSGQRLSMSVHSHQEAVRARRAGADMVFVSPLYPTQSHPGAGHLGPLKARILARQAKVPAFALGGINIRNAASCSHGLSGFGAISALLLAP